MKSACKMIGEQKLIILSEQAGKTNFYLVADEPWYQRARQLVLLGQTGMALSLIENEENQRFASSQLSIDDPLRQKYHLLLTLMGFYYFDAGDLDQAAQLFARTSFDFSQLLIRFKNLLPSNIRVEIDPYFLPIDSKEIMKVEDKLAQECEIDYNEVLLRYMKFLYKLATNFKSKSDEGNICLIHNILLKLFVRIHALGKNSETDFSNSFLTLASRLVRFCDLEEVTSYYETHNAFHAKALLLYWTEDSPELALEIWKRLAVGELVDPFFPGVDFYALMLSLFDCEIRNSDIVQETSSSTSDFLACAPFKMNGAKFLVTHLRYVLNSNKNEATKTAEAILKNIPVLSHKLCNYLVPESETQTFAEFVLPYY
ncbi:transforming growth factor, beta receptor associated protein 1 [Cichlidogyrus casuarinus]|uniref:Transforming growth factor, beta receptor associated protein 1 n=1 Tax=Cichlidogyrus casuarinus TaxID=1844966 RepID=A0ABD2QEF0_9PLAT